MHQAETAIAMEGRQLVAFPETMLEAQNASASHDLRPALAALGMVMRQCVACHAAYRLH